MAEQFLNNTEEEIDIGLPIRQANPDAKFPIITKPKPIGFFSLNEGRDFEAGQSGLHYYKRPPVLPINLNMIYRKSIYKRDNVSCEALYNILSYLHHSYETVFPRNGNENPEFVAWRDLLSLIMRTPYEYNKDWCIHITRFNNVFYMIEKLLSESLRRSKNQPEKHKSFAGWEFKFKQSCLWEAPRDGNAARKKRDDDCTEFSCIYQIRLENLNLMFTAEMDGVISNNVLQLDYYAPNLANLEFVQLQLRQNKFDSQEEEMFLRYETCDWWSKSFLTGLKYLLVGMHNHKGYLVDIQRYCVDKLCTIGKEQFWSPGLCLHFLYTFLLRVKQIVSNNNCPYTVHEFHFNAHKGRIYYKRWAGISDYTFLPSWYLKLVHLSNLNK